MNADLPELRFRDLVTFLAVRRCQSVRGAARELKVPPSQVSKALERLSQSLGRPLISRTARGIVLTQHANTLGPILEETVTRLEQVVRGGKAPPPRIAIAAPSYLLTAFFPAIRVALPNHLLRALEMPPAVVRALAPERLFDVALSAGREPMPEAWVTEPVGEIRKALFGSPRVATRLGRFPIRPERVAELPFVSPVYMIGGQVAPGHDDCPLPAKERFVSDEVMTIGMALEIAARSEQVVFGPFIAAKRLVDLGMLVELPVEGWNVAQTLCLSCHSDRVLAQVQRALVRAMGAAIEELSHPARRADEEIGRVERAKKTRKRSVRNH